MHASGEIHAVRIFGAEMRWLGVIHTAITNIEDWLRSSQSNKAASHIIQETRRNARLVHLMSARNRFLLDAFCLCCVSLQLVYKKKHEPSCVSIDDVQKTEDWWRSSQSSNAIGRIMLDRRRNSRLVHLMSNLSHREFPQTALHKKRRLI